MNKIELMKALYNAIENMRQLPLHKIANTLKIAEDEVIYIKNWYKMYEIALYFESIDSNGSFIECMEEVENITQLQEEVKVYMDNIEVWLENEILSKEESKKIIDKLVSIMLAVGVYN